MESKAKLLRTLLAIFLTAALPRMALAASGLSCAHIYSPKVSVTVRFSAPSIPKKSVSVRPEPKPHVPTQKISSSVLELLKFSDLRERVRNAESLEEALNLRLSSGEKKGALQDFREILAEHDANLSEIIRFQDANKVEGLDFYIRELNDWSRSLTSEILQFESQGTYKDLNMLSMDVARYATALEFISSHVKAGDVSVIREKMNGKWYDLYTSDHYREDARLSILDSLSIAHEMGIVFIPTAREITIYDFNRMLGQGIAPIGLISKTVLADGRMYDPYQFLLHDIGHALTSAGRVSEKILNSWKTLLVAVDNQTPAMREAMHVLLFMTTHEGIFVRLDRTSLLNGLRSIPYQDRPGPRTLDSFGLITRLQKENYWETQNLRKEPSLEAFLRQANEQLTQLIAESF